MQSDVANDSISNLATMVIIFGIIITTGIYFLTLKKYISAAPFRFFAQMVIMVSFIVSLAAYLFINQITANPTIVVTAGITGLVLGMLIFGTRKIFVYKGSVEIKRGIIPILLIMFAYLTSSFFNVFGNPNLMSLGVVLVVFATGIAVGSVTADSINGINLGGERKKVKTGMVRSTTNGQPGNEIDKTDDTNGPLRI
jgi:hypothetical protein